MKSKMLIFFVFFICYILCILGLSTMTNATAVTNILSAAPAVSKAFIIEPMLATISGGILSSGVFFFFFKRMLDQYDKKHDKNDAELKSLHTSLIDLELTIVDKLHGQADDLHHDLNVNLGTVTKTVLDNLSIIRETMQGIIADLAAFKAEHKKCDYSPGDIKILQNQLSGVYARIDKKQKTV